MPAGIDWDDHLIARFTALHKDGKRSFQEIADTLAREFGLKLTKNACIGKARRLGLAARPHVAPPLPRKGQKRGGPRPVPVVLPGWQVEPPPRLPPAAGKITIYQLRGGVCHFPHGEKPPYTYCGAVAKKGSWCPHHERVVYPRGTSR
jgi:hypothetical protein